MWLPGSSKDLNDEASGRTETKEAPRVSAENNSERVKTVLLKLSVVKDQFLFHFV